MSDPIETDPEIVAMRRASRGARGKALVAVLGILVGGGVWVARGPSELRAVLASEGHTEIAVTAHGPFELGYVSTKGDMSCGGTATRLPFSLSRTSSCFSSAPPTPTRSDAETLTESLSQRLPSIGVVRCADIAPDAPRAVCTVVADAGAPVEFVFDRKGREWVQASPERLLLRTDLAEKITAELLEKAKKPITADCGSGLLGYATGDHLTCSAQYGADAGPKKPASIDVVFTEGGGYRWTASGL